MLTNGHTVHIIYFVADADLAHLVERHLAKVEVASSSLVTRSIFILWRHSQVVRQKSAKLLRPSSNLGGASRNPVHESGRDFYFLPLTKVNKLL